MEGIIRPTTQNDRQFFDHDLNKPKRKRNSREKFIEELNTKEKVASKAGKPFAKAAARDDFENALQSQISEQVRQHGSVEYPEKLKVPEMDWDKYSDVKSFELVETKKVRDNNLSKNHRMPIFIQAKVYKFKGYGNTYTVMEDPDVAVDRTYKESENAKGGRDGKNTSGSPRKD